MTPEFFQFLAIMVAIIGVGVSLAVLIVTLLNQQERRTNQRIDRLEDRMDRGFEHLRAEMNQQSDGLRAEMNQQSDGLRAEMNQQSDGLRAEMNQQSDGLRAEVNRQYESLRTEMNRRFDEQDVRIRGLEQGQAYMSGQFSELKDHLTHRSPTGNNPESGD